MKTEQKAVAGVGYLSMMHVVGGRKTFCKFVCISSWNFMNNVDNILHKIKDSVNSTDPEATVILYGSTARGGDRDESDIDILILLSQDKITWADEKRVSYPLYEIEFDTGKLISPLVLSKKDWETKHKITPFIIMSLEREGLYDASGKR